MSDPYVGEIAMFAGTFAPSGWLLCNGQSVQINQAETLYQLIGTTYGGDGQTYFNVPNLMSRVPVHQGVSRYSGATYQVAQTGGSETVTLLQQQLPVHSHGLAAAGTPGNVSIPAPTVVLANQGPSGTATPTMYGPYSTPNDQVSLANGTLVPAGASQPHANIQPVLAINFIISLYGVYPQQA